MPPVIAAAITAAGVTGGITIGATTVTYASILAYAITTGAALGASLLLSQQQQQRRGDPQQVTVKQAMPARLRSYGRVKIGGAYAFMETAAGALYQLICHGEGEWDAIEEWWLNDQNALLSGGVVTALPWGSNIAIESLLGAADQPASPMLTGAFPGTWTDDHRLRGQALSVIRYGWVREKVFQKVYPNGAPGLRVVARTAKVLDPRSGLVAWTENPSLQALDHAKHRDGLRIPSAMIDAASFAAHADHCDEAVALAGGGTEPRYRSSLTYDLTRPPIETHRALLAACDAETYASPEGKLAIRGGWQEPGVVLDDSLIRTVRRTPGNGKLSACNRLKLSFSDPAADYQPNEVEPWEDLASQATRGVLEAELALTQVQYWRQLRRLGKLEFHRRNPRHRLSLTTHPGGIIALGERFVTIRIARLGIDEAFRIERCEILFERGKLSGCRIEAVSMSVDARSWNPETDEGTPPNVPQDTTTETVVPVPTGLTLSLVHAQPSPGVWTVQLRGEVDEIAGQPWETLGRYRKLGDATWIEMADDGEWRVLSSVLEDGSVYEVQAAHAGYGGADSANLSDWTASVLIAAVADPAQVNLLQHSDDPDGWITPVRVGITSGAQVADPLGGTAARALTFAADSGRIYAQGTIAGALSGRTFTLSVYVRAPAGKARIVVAANSDTQFLLQDVALTGSWQRITQMLTCAGADTVVRLALENRTAAGASDPAAGVVEVFGGMIQENAVATTYRSTP